MRFAINAYSGSWVLVETIALFRTREDAIAAEGWSYWAQHRPGLTLVIEEVRLK